MKINADVLSDKIRKSIQQLRLWPELESERFVIFETGEEQVQVVITRDEDEFCAVVADGVVE